MDITVLLWKKYFKSDGLAGMYNVIIKQMSKKKRVIVESRCGYTDAFCILQLFCMCENFYNKMFEKSSQCKIITLFLKQSIWKTVEMTVITWQFFICRKTSCALSLNEYL